MGFAALAIAALGLCLASTAAAGSTTKVLTGHINPDQVYSFVYVPFDVPVGTQSIYVYQNYSLKGQGNACDLGVFDPRGHEDPQGVGFRGWSGGYRNNFTITEASATPGYIAGAVYPGTWNVVLGPYTSVPSGIDYELTVTLSTDPVPGGYFAPNFSPSRVGPDPAPAEKWYRGDFHVHTYFSDGDHAPSFIVDMAKNQSLDFFYSTDHNTQASNLIWGEAHPADMFVGRGIEVTTRSGHWGALGLDRWQWIDFRPQANTPGVDLAFANVREAGGFVSINHPYISCPACNWTLSDFVDADGIEVWNGPFDGPSNQTIAKWQELLVAGNRVTALGGSDYHRAPRLVGQPTTVVRTNALTDAGIMDALRRQRVYIVEGPGMEIDFTVTAASGQVTEVGDVVTGSGAFTAQVKVTGMNGGILTLIGPKGPIYQQKITASPATITHKKIEGDFVRVEIRDAAGSMLGLTNPIYFHKS
ncbi:PHP domain protein [Lyophyllum atratum]|nr:PHP domain protein [Lyophyllum atratum]